MSTLNVDKKHNILIHHKPKNESCFLKPRIGKIRFTKTRATWHNIVFIFYSYLNNNILNQKQ